MKKYDAIVFDIDNVLIDTRGSYTDCIRRAVEVYLEQFLDFSHSRSPLLTREDIETFKSLGGFNDDWDTAYGLILYFASLKPMRHSINELRRKKSLPKLTETKLPYPLGVRGAERKFKKHQMVTIRRVASIFQHLYLTNFMWHEKPFIHKRDLLRLKRAGLKIGIVTGRNRDEALFSLRRFQLDGAVDKMVTLTETPKTLKKPNPYGLLRVAKRLGETRRFLYVGDLPDDMLAVKSSKQKIDVEACGFVQAALKKREMTERLKRAGARYICANAGELFQIALPSKNQGTGD